ncbi:hypothetical protein AK830_g2230 [Neonectria ditissima]|uniref:RBR-type E3 ubiquitin transferase n=1 Tax=Neonectria ditissima TaxID=78410 RepID=A0A0P7BFW0_9HYPO|nr:hypothetical protein AK830_g2230 [Neonectria ditissima]
MFRNFKKKATTVFRKKKAPTSTDPPPDYSSVTTTDTTNTDLNTTFSTLTTNARDREAVPPAPLPPSPPLAPLIQREPTPPLELETPVAEPVDPTPEPAHSDPFAPKYVPYIEASPLKNNMLVNAGIYGHINPDIMGGFGGDDESIWLVDDEETDEEQQGHDEDEDEATRETLAETGSQHNSDTRSEAQSRQSRSSHRSQRSRTSSREEVPLILDPLQQQAPSAPNPMSAQPAFHYNTPALLDDDEFASFSTTTPETPPSNRTSMPRLGYAPISASILDLDDMAIDDFEEPPKEAPKSRDETIQRDTTIPASSSTSLNPYVALFEQQDRAMTVAYLRRLDQSGDEVADDFRCPECRELLEYADIQRYANKQTFMRYETLALRAAMSEADNFAWCTSGCGSGQIHESGDEQPIVTCLHCSHRSCFHHKVPWHENLSCDEYDQLLADPENFRSRLELENEAWSESQRAQLEADRAMAQNMMADEQAEMQRREERARQERDQARKAAELVRQIAARRKREEKQSEATVNSTTKPCPGCGWAIEKNDGCSHMTCIQCKFEFCWSCYNKWQKRHNVNCRGGR